MSGFTQDAVTVFLGFFAVMNPIANTDVFVSLTNHENKISKIKIASKALLLSLCIVIVLRSLGSQFFTYLALRCPPCELRAVF